jgi:hypothetical protein
MKRQNKLIEVIDFTLKILAKTLQTELTVAGTVTGFHRIPY